MHESGSLARLSAAVVILLIVLLSIPAMAMSLTSRATQAETVQESEPGVSMPKKFNFPKIETQLGLRAGYRVDDFDWNIAGDINGTNPNVLSELTWDDLEIFQVKADAKTIVRRALYLRGSLGYGRILDGENQDSDFAGDDRTLEWSRSNNSADDGSVWDATLGIGYQFRLASEKFRITPLVGYSYHKQNLTMTDGVQTVSEPDLAPDPFVPPDLGPFKQNLDNTYNARWDGPWVGVDLMFRPSERWAFTGIFEYHWADYEAEANWNLRTDFAHPKSFEHEADGDGFVLSVGCDYAMNDQFSLNLTLDFQDWSTDPGIDRTFFFDGTIDETRLNEVNWESYGIMLGVAIRF